MCSARPSRLRRPVPTTRPKKAEYTAVSHQPSHEAVESVAEYIANMSAELATLAGGAGLDTLAYLLNLARLEAESHLPKLNNPSS